jgi:Zn finger protein HypA/HybF involved in hydrogenase expression
MFIQIEQRKRKFIRESKLGKEHAYYRDYSVLIFRCDSCNVLFERERGSMNPNRINNHYFHCCPKCDSKRFAQKKGAERRTIWDKPASITSDISKM